MDNSAARNIIERDTPGTQVEVVLCGGSIQNRYIEISGRLTSSTEVCKPSLIHLITMAAKAAQDGAGAHPSITILKRQRQDIPISQNKFLKKTARGKVLQCRLLMAQANPKSYESATFEMTFRVDLQDALFVQSFQATARCSHCVDTLGTQSTLTPMATGS